jgi:hypothetical protein
MAESPAGVRRLPAPSIGALALLQHVSNFWLCRALWVAAELGLADALAEGPKTPAELARRTGCQEDPLRRLLRALAPANVFADCGDGRYDLTPLSEVLREGVPGSLRAYVRTELGGERYAAWGELLHSLRTGEPGFDRALGMPFWEFFSRNPERARIFDQAMVALSHAVIETVLDVSDFSGVKTVVDVGGGQGGLLLHLLRAHPEMQGVLYDRAAVVEGARKEIEAAGLAGRCRAQAGDFFESVPDGADRYLLKLVIHDWPDELAIRILRACRRAMHAASRLVLIEAVVPEGAAPHPSRLLDLSMLAVTGGRERTAAEYEALLAAADLRRVRVAPTLGPMSLIEAAPC